VRGPVRFLVLAAVAAVPAVVLGQATPLPIDVEIGYRFADIKGNDDMYRSQVNERDGFLLENLDLTLGAGDLGSASGLADHVSLHATQLFAGPAGALRLDGGRAGAYTISLRYMRTELFSALPAFANPFAGQGVVPGEQTQNFVRNMIDADLRLLPDGPVVPIIGYTFNRASGPGRTTYTVGQDEFQLAQNWTDTDQEFRLGAAFHFGAFAGEVTQGWRTTTDRTESARLPGAGNGNDSGAVLGVPVSLSSLSRTQQTDTNVPVTHVSVGGALGSRVRVTAGFFRAAGESETAQAENLAGNLVSFELSRFFSGLAESAQDKARNRAWQANGRVEASLTPEIDLVAGYERSHRNLDGYALISDLFLATTTFSGQDPRNLEELIQSHTSLARTDGTADVLLVGRPIDGLSLRAGVEQTNEDLAITPDASEIVIPGGQGGDFSRRLRAFTAGVTLAKWDFRLTGDLRRESADQAVLRTDFLSRTRTRVRLGWQGLKWLEIGMNAEQTDASNDSSGIASDGRTREYGGDLTVRPVPALEFRASSAVFRADSSILIREPQDFFVEPSVNSEDGKSMLVGVTVDLSPVHFVGNYSRLDNTGSYAFKLDRFALRASFDLTTSFAASLEWNRDKYRENFPSALPLGNFDGDRYTVSLRWHP
jgi:hypothetical protein